MIIRFKGITPERTEDAPFMGALVCAIGCSRGCSNCFNQYMKDEPIQYIEAQEIIKTIKNNIFNQGIILGGLEWTEQPEEMMELIKLAQQNNLQIMLYTGMDEMQFRNTFPTLADIWIKVGRYNETLQCNDNVQYGVKLATSNQKIIKL